MMRDDYLNGIIHRGNELAVLEQAAFSFPKKDSLIRWVVAAAFGMLFSMIPSVCSAQAFFQII